MSDHCQISLSLNMNYYVPINATCSLEPFPSRYIWQNDSAENFQQYLSSNDIQEKIRIFDQTSFDDSELGIETMVSSFNDIIYNVADNILRKKFSFKKKKIQKTETP